MSSLAHTDDPAHDQPEPPDDGLRSVDDARSYIRDVIAISTLPAIWMGAKPERIAESLLAVIETTVRPAFSYIRIGSPIGEKPVERAMVRGSLVRGCETTKLGEQVCAWVAQHDPEEILTLRPFDGEEEARSCAYPLGHDAGFGVLAAGFTGDDGSPSRLQRALLNIAANHTITACRNFALQQQARAAREETQALYEVSQSLAAELDLQTIMQLTTDAATRLTQAKFGAFFHNLIDDRGESYMLYSLSGAPREAFEKFGMPRNTPLFDHTFKGRGPMRVDDVLADPRYGTMSPHHGMPRGHLPVRSYLAVPVVSRNGKVLGGLFFGHPDVGVFTERAERIATGIASHAAVALDNSRLFARAEQEIEQRTRTEEALRESEGRLQMAKRAAHIGIHDYDVASGSISWDERTRQLWEVEDDEPITYEVWLNALHPDDHERAVADVQRVFDNPSSSEYYSEYRIITRKTREERWIEATGHITCIDGRPARLVGTVRDIGERKRYEHALREADRRKDEFLATLAHELRNPLAPIRMAAKIIRQTKDDPQRFDEMTAIIERQSLQLVCLIDDLLDVSRITRGKIALRRQHVDLGDVIDQAVEVTLPICNDSNLQLTVKKPHEPVALHADPVRITQIIGNLLNNACKFTEAGGSITLSAGRDGGHAVIHVKDTGIGIDVRQLSTIFEMFAQVDQAPNRAPAGLGIGLSLAKSLAQLHGGTIEAASEGVGKGSIFTVRLPVAASSAHANDTSTPEAQAAPAKATARKILAVDDHADALQSVAMLLRLAGHEVLTATAGSEALRLAEQHRPEVILLDIGLPGLDGYEVARRLRAQPWGREALLIAMTGWGQERDKRTAAEAGFDAHLTKPADPEALAHLLSSSAGA